MKNCASNFKVLKKMLQGLLPTFVCWYVSGNHKRDLSAKDEGLKYANSFFHDLIQEADEIKEEME